MLNDNRSFEQINLGELLNHVAALKADKMRFVQMHAVRKPGGFDLHYTFADPSTLQALNWVVRVDDGQQVPSISSLYPSAFFNENEAHDLFGVEITGINLDYHGTFYQVSTPAPMNPDYVDGKPPVQAASSSSDVEAHMSDDQKQEELAQERSEG